MVEVVPALRSLFVTVTTFVQTGLRGQMANAPLTSTVHNIAMITMIACLLQLQQLVQRVNYSSDILSLFSVGKSINNDIQHQPSSSPSGVTVWPIAVGVGAGGVFLI